MSRPPSHHNRARVTCKNCGFTIQLPYKCRFEYPLHFAVKCPKCEYENVYHRLEVIQGDDEYCEKALEKAEELVKPLRDAVTGSLLLGAVYSSIQAIIETLPEKPRKGDN